MRKLVFLLLTVGALMSVTTISAQDRSVTWNRWDVVIDQIDTTNNRFQVSELYDIRFDGTFRFGSAEIPNRNLESIRDVQVFENGVPLQPTCSQQAGTFCVSYPSGLVSITYYFRQPITNGEQTFELRYVVNGALRSYAGGDQLWWNAVTSEHYGFPILDSTIMVQLPAGFGPREGIDPVVTYGAPTDIEVRGTTVTAVATRALGGDEGIEIRVQYPHNPNMAVPAWQARFDQQRDYEENVAPLISLAAFGLAALIGIGGSLFFVITYLRKGRDPEIGPVPTYLSEPPSDLPPAIVGTLIDERADPRDVISTVIDLAQREYLVIEESRKEGLFGLGGGSEFTFKRTDKATAGLRPFEQKMLTSLFPRNQLTRTMASLRDTFYTVIATIQADLYKELVSEQFFERSPNDTRARWTGLASLMLFGAIFLGVFIISEGDGLGGINPFFLMVPGALLVVAVLAMVIAPAMPAKTRKGAEEAAKWRAFYEYLRNVDQYADVTEAAQQFDRYLPYAVAFGLDRTWINSFRSVEVAPIPGWYFPTYVGRYRGGYIAGSPFPRSTSMGGGAGMPGDLARAGGGGLNDISGGLAGGLSSISSGMTDMLNSATRVMTSRPQQTSGSSGSWRSGGGSFSGGGGGGGGFSGGGSRGFG